MNEADTWVQCNEIAHLRHDLTACPHCGRVYYCEKVGRWGSIGDTICATCPLFASSHNDGDTWIELELSAILDHLAVRHLSQSPISGTNYIADEYLPEANLVIEAMGDYWHSLPETVEKDARRRFILRKLGYRLCEIAESEFRNSERLKSRIRQVISGSVRYYERLVSRRPYRTIGRRSA